MGLIYKLSEIDKLKSLEDLRIKLAPRDECRNYVQENGGEALLIKKEELNSHVLQKEFLDGPYMNSFGDGYGEPYNQNRQAFGKLKNDLIVYCELSEYYCEKTHKILSQVSNRNN